MRTAVGVDAGGTSTTAIASRDGVAGKPSSAEPANASSRGVAAAAEAIARAIDGALGGDHPAAIFVGAAGAGHDDVATALTAALAMRYASVKIVVRDDALIALRSGVRQGDGIVLIAGTGSIAYAEIDGKAHRSGGYGYLLGDEGSGFAIGNAAARLFARALDDRAPRDLLVEAVGAHLGVSSARGLADRIYRGGNPVAELAGLAPIVLDHAARGERSAAKIVQSAALELGDLLKAITRKSGSAERELPIVFAGGLLRTNSLLTFLLETRISNELPSMHVVKGSPDPCAGALALAEAMLS